MALTGAEKQRRHRERWKNHPTKSAAAMQKAYRDRLRNNRPDDYQKMCQASNERHTKWREANLDLSRKLARDYRNTNLEERKQYEREWRAVNRDRKRAVTQQWSHSPVGILKRLGQKERQWEKRIRESMGEVSPKLLEALRLYRRWHGRNFKRKKGPRGPQRRIA